MRLEEIARRSWRNIEVFAAALAYDEREDIEARVRRLEQQVADLNARMPAVG